MVQGEQAKGLKGVARRLIAGLAGWSSHTSRDGTWLTMWGTTKIHVRRIERKEKILYDNVLNLQYVDVSPSSLIVNFRRLGLVKMTRCQVV